MKFFALVALLGSAAALRFNHIDGQSLVQRVHTQEIQNVFAKRRAQKLMKVQWENLTKAQEKEIEDWVVSELTTGDKTITKAEAEAAIKAFGESHGFEPLPKKAWEELEKMFDAADTNNDGQIDLDEMLAAC